MRTICATLILTVVLAMPASAQMSNQRFTPADLPTGATNAANLLREEAAREKSAREMDERIERHQRGERRLTSGICDGCSRATTSARRRVVPPEMVGEDGLAYRPEDLLE